MPRVTTDEEFIDAWRRLRSASKVADFLKVSTRSVFNRRRSLEAKHGIELDSDGKENAATTGKDGAAMRLSSLAAERARRYERDIQETVTDGVVMIASDCHYWPGIVSTAHDAFCRLAKQLKPSMVVLNGDILDGARISRHARIMWERQPELKDEIAAVQDRCAEIERAARGARLLRTIGNHDARFENYLASNAPAFEEMTGTTLLDYLPRWRAGWAIHLNQGTDSWTTIRHRPISGGVHSAFNSTLKAGVHYVHGHLHQLKVTPWADYRGRRYGIDTGTLAEPYGPQFNYTEAGPLNWASGGAVLTYRAGVLLPPELLTVDRGVAYFRGQAI